MSFQEVLSSDMRVLGIDTSTPCGGIGLIDHGKIISDYLLNIPVTHSERLLEAIEMVLKGARFKIENLDGWAISLGPGSFTGLRIGVSTVKGLALATEKPVAGVPTLDVLASQVTPTPHLICPILDAKKKEVYAAFYQYDQNHSLKRLTPYQSIRPEDLIKKIEAPTIFLGEGVNLYGEFIQKSLPTLSIFPPPILQVSHGSMVAKLGAELLQRGESLDLFNFTPIYVRASEAEMKWRDKVLKE